MRANDMPYEKASGSSKKACTRGPAYRLGKDEYNDHRNDTDTESGSKTKGGSVFVLSYEESVSQIIDQNHDHTDDRRHDIADNGFRYRGIPEYFC